MTIGVGGSAANPPHNGHFNLLQNLIEKKIYDKIIWIPSGYRTDKDIEIAPVHRIAMTELIICREWRLLYCPIFEIDYSEIYGQFLPTFKRLFDIQIENPRDTVVFFTGTDSNVKDWINGELILKHFRVDYIPRENHYPELKTLDIETIPDISSRDIRNRIKDNKEIRHLTSDSVAKYIQKYDLYK